MDRATHKSDLYPTTASEVLKAYKRGKRDFRYADLDGANFAGAKLEAARFYGASLRNADFSGARLTHVQFKGADLTGCSLENAAVNASDLIDADFTGANLRYADFTGASLLRAVCEGANLNGVNLGNASTGEIDLEGADLTGVRLSFTHLGDTDVRPFCNARRIKHSSPSHVDPRTIMRSYTHPHLKQFLLDCGVPQLFAEYMIDCAWALGEPILRSLMQSTFISYGGPDEAFARKLYDALRAHGVVVFFFPETARVGERINNEVFRQIQEHDRVLLVCSQASLDRSGVINEIQETLDREARDGGVTYLLPIMLDDYVLTGWHDSQPVLAERIGRRIIADFRKAKRSRAAFTAALARVVDALKVRPVGS